MDYKKKEAGREEGREGGRSQNRQLHAVVSGDGWAALLFQSVSLFWPALARVT